MANRLVSALVRAGIFPPDLELNTLEIAWCKLWEPGNGGPIQPFLDKVTGIMVYPRDEPPNTTSTILGAVLSSQNVCLQQLYVASADGVLASIEPVLAAYGRVDSLQLDIDHETQCRSVLNIIASQRGLEFLRLTNWDWNVVCNGKLLVSLSALFLSFLVSVWVYSIPAGGRGAGGCFL